MPKKDPKQFAKDLRKSIDFRDVTVAIDDAKQHFAEENASPGNVAFFKIMTDDMEVGDVTRFIFQDPKTVTLSKKAEGLFNAFTSDDLGQIEERYADTTIEILVKDLEVKGLMLPSFPEEPEAAPGIALELSPSPSAPISIRISLGDLQIEITKSLQDVVENQIASSDIRKALKSFAKSTNAYMNLSNDTQTAKEILTNWDLHGERFNQILFAIDQVKKGNK